MQELWLIPILITIDIYFFCQQYKSNIDKKLCTYVHMYALVVADHPNLK